MHSLVATLSVMVVHINMWLIPCGVALLALSSTFDTNILVSGRARERCVHIPPYKPHGGELFDLPTDRR